MAGFTVWLSGRVRVAALPAGVVSIAMEVVRAMMPCRCSRMMMCANMPR